MIQLTIEDILKVIQKLLDEGMTTTEIAKLPIYIGDDDELNGIHTAWYAQVIENDNEDDADLVQLINENHPNIMLTDKAILIS